MAKFSARLAGKFCQELAALTEGAENSAEPIRYPFLRTGWQILWCLSVFRIRIRIDFVFLDQEQGNRPNFKNKPDFQPF
jgi:hypothetical protein